MGSARLLVSTFASTFTTWVLLAAPGGATPVDVSGSWQANIDCGLTATASLLLHLDEDSASGAVTARMLDCGTFEVPGAIRRPSSCVVTPAVMTGEVTGNDVMVPSNGNYMSDAHVPAFPFFSCTAATEIVSSHHLSGVVQADDAGRAVGITGSWVNGPVDFDDASGATCWSYPSPSSCSLDMRRNDVSVGHDVGVSPRQGATVTFEDVTAPGVVSVMPLTDADASVPPQFEVLGAGSVPIFYDVHTTAAFTGTVTSCFAYPDANGDGLVDGAKPPLDENDLRVLHAENGTFVDRTASLDTTAKVICGATESLSQLAVAHPPGNAPSDSTFAGIPHLTLRRRRSGTQAVRFFDRFYRSAGVDAAEDPRMVGATFEIFSKTDSTVAHFDMPAAGWKATPAGNRGTRYRFTNSAAPNTESPVAWADFTAYPTPLYYPGFRIVSRAVGLALSGPQGAIGVRFTVGSRRWCATFRELPTDHANLVELHGSRRYGGLVTTDDCADRRMRWALTR